MIVLTFYDTVTPLLSELAVRSPNLAREALQAAGAKLQKAARSELKRKVTYWHQEVKDGRRIIYKGSPQRLGTRISHTTGEVLNPDNMASFISFYMSPNNPNVVTVGGAHPDFTPLKYRGGKVVGTMGKIKAVGKIGRSIIHKLNTGKLDENHPYRERSWIPNAKYERRAFMESAYLSSKSNIEQTVLKRFDMSFREAVNTIKVKEVRRKYA